MVRPGTGSPSFVADIFSLQLSPAWMGFSSVATNVMYSLAMRPIWRSISSSSDSNGCAVNFTGP